jgi:hypothetical protein
VTTIYRISNGLALSSRPPWFRIEIPTIRNLPVPRESHSRL